MSEKQDVSATKDLAIQQRADADRMTCEYLEAAIALEDNYARTLCKQTGTIAMNRCVAARNRAKLLRDQLKEIRQRHS